MTEKYFFADGFLKRQGGEMKAELIHPYDIYELLTVPTTGKVKDIIDLGRVFLFVDEDGNERVIMPTTTAEPTTENGKKMLAMVLPPR